MEVVGQTTHPHIVHAYDAGPVGARLVLVMEYVDGVDLDRLVKECGPLPVPEACAYIQQAACGLQHAHEKGLIHRDIKPSNLLVSGGACGKDAKSTRADHPATVKILDLGLARLQHPARGSRTADLTQEFGDSATHGTPDYLAPEQALDFHGAGIPADIYGLGCTFYFFSEANRLLPADPITRNCCVTSKRNRPPSTSSGPMCPPAWAKWCSGC